MLGLAVIGGGGLIQARITDGKPIQRTTSSDLMDLYARQAREAMVLQKPMVTAPQRASQQETILQEDFSGLTGGTEEEPGAEVGSYTVDGNSAWPDDITSIPGWWGIGTYAIDGSLGLCHPGVGGVVCSGPMNMYGNLHVSFRAKARVGNTEGFETTMIVSIVMGDKSNPVAATPETFIPVHLKVEDGWQDIELNFRCPNTGDDSRLQINGMTYSRAGFVIDDIKITRDFDFCLPPVSLSCGDFTDDGFTINWEPGAENNSYLFSMFKEKKLSEAFNGTESFDDGLPQYWTTDGSLVNEGGVDNSSALKIEKDQQLTVAFGGGRIAAMSLFMKGNSNADSEATVHVIGLEDGNEVELGYFVVRNLPEEGMVIDLSEVLYSRLYVLDGIKFVSDGFENGQYCVIDDLTYQASPACERFQVISEKVVSEPKIVLTELDPEDEYYVGVKGVKNEEFSSDFFGYFYVAGMPAPKATQATDIEKRGAYTANWTPSPKAVAYTVNNYAVNTIDKDQENYVVLRDDFTNANDANQESISQMSFDDWADCKGWRASRIPDGFTSIALVDAGYVGVMGMPIYSPAVSLNNGDGSFTVRFKVKAFGGELIVVKSNGEAQYYDFAEVNPDGDPYEFEEHEVKMSFDKGTDVQSISFEGTYYTILLDWVEITQNVKAGDKLIKFNSSAEVTGHDSSEYRFTGLENNKDVSYAYSVVSHGEYIGQKFSSDLSNLVYVDLNQSGIRDTLSKEGETRVCGMQGAIAVILSEPAVVDVVSASGTHVADVKAAEGMTIVNLPAGLYIVRAGDSTSKVLVR